MSTPPSSAESRPRWYLVYFILVAFDLITISLSLVLNHRIMTIYLDSVNVSQQWAERTNGFSELEQLAAAVNAPGNDVFVTRDVEGESLRFDERRQAFYEQLRRVRKDLESNVDPEVAPRLLDGLTEVEAAMQELSVEAGLIFDSFRSDEPDLAGERMATMDRHFFRLSARLADLQRDVRQIQGTHFEEQTEAAGSLRRIEYLIAGCIVIIVGGATMYGHRLTREMRAASEQRVRHLAELGASEARAQELVEQRTAELRASMERVRQSDRLATIGTLAAGLGHDMNNMLLPMRCRLDALDSNDPNPGANNGSSDLQAIRESLDYLQHLADGLHLIALDPDNARASGERTVLDDWWSRVSPLLVKTIPSDITLEVAFEPDLPAVAIPAHQLTQAVLNLVVNAGDAIGEGAGTIMIRAARTNESVQVSVGDTGQGMDEETRLQAIDLFYTTKARGRSTGLGLPLVLGAVKAAGGSLDIDSALGSGTTVSLILPCAEGASAPSDRSVHRPEAVISLADARTAGYVAALLTGAGYACSRDEPEAVNERTRVWVTDNSDATRTRTRELADEASDCRLLILGSANEAWDGLQARVVDPAAGHDVLRRAIRDVVDDIDQVSFT